MRARSVFPFVFAALCSALSGCGTVGPSPILQVRFPAVENFIGARGELPTFSVANSTNGLIGSFWAYNEKVADIYPNENVFARNQYFSVPTQVPVTIVFHDENGQYQGVFARVLEVGPGAPSVSWIIGESEIVRFGRPLPRPDVSAPVYEPTSREIRLPRRTNMESWGIVVNDTPYELLVRRNGQIRARIKSGTSWSLRSEMVVPGNLARPTLIDIYGFAPDGTQLGTAQFQIDSRDWGVAARHILISPGSLRR